MKLRIEKPFMDKYTMEEYAEGNIIEVSDKRGSELLADERGLVSKIVPKAKKKKSEE